MRLSLFFYKWAGLELNQRHTDFQLVDQKSQERQNQTLTTNPNHHLQTSLQNNSENAPNQPQNLPEDLAEIIAAWAKLPPEIQSAILTLIRATQSGTTIKE